MPFPEKLSIPAEVLRIAEKLESAGFETWCVGGAIRDTLLGLENKDFDLATAAKPDEIRKLFRRNIPIGIEHGTVAVLDRHKVPHEVTTFRQDVVTDGRHAQVRFGVSLDDDLARRDFTINAIAYHPLRHEWRDLYDGQGDLDRKLIRAVGDPNRRFQEDYLRILRALRFAARFGFEIEPATWEAAKTNAHGLEHLSAERVREEWFRGLAGAGKPSELVRSWGEVGAVEVWMPELVKGEKGKVNGWAKVIDALDPPDPILTTCYLSADPRATLSRLKCSNAEVERGSAFEIHFAELPNPEEAVDVRRWMSKAGAAVDDCVTVAVAEGRGSRLRVAVEAVRRSSDPLTLRELAVTGNELMEAGIPKGPQIGSTLHQLLEHVLENPALNTKSQLLALLSDPSFHVSPFKSHEGADQHKRPSQ